MCRPLCSPLANSQAVLLAGCESHQQPAAQPVNVVPQGASSQHSRRRARWVWRGGGFRGAAKRAGQETSRRRRLGFPRAQPCQPAVMAISGDMAAWLFSTRESVWRATPNPRRLGNVQTKRDQAVLFRCCGQDAVDSSSPWRLPPQIHCCRSPAHWALQQRHTFKPGSLLIEGVQGLGSGCQVWHGVGFSYTWRHPPPAPASSSEVGL